MLAILLNSGVGSRMGELTAHSPKCLLEVAQKATVLSRQIDRLLWHGVKRLLITTGGFHDQIQAYVEERYRDADLAVTYIRNPRFRETNYIYSMHLLQGLVNDNVLLMHGDLVFDHEVFDAFMTSSLENRVLVNSGETFPDKDFKAVIARDRVTRIAIDVDRDCKFALPLYKFSREAYGVWMARISAYVAKGKTGVYAEDALNEVLDRVQLQPAYFHNGLCQEVDTLEDLNEIRASLALR